MTLPSHSWSTTSPSSSAAGGAAAHLIGLDLELDADGDLVADTDLHLTRGVDAVVQALRIRLQLLRGEWFLDLDLGMPWFDEILGRKPTPLARARALVRAAALDTPGVAAVERVAVTVDAPTRRLAVDLSCRTTAGALAELGLSP